MQVRREHVVNVQHVSRPASLVACYENTEPNPECRTGFGVADNGRGPDAAPGIRHQLRPTIPIDVCELNDLMVPVPVSELPQSGEQEIHWKDAPILAHASLATLVRGHEVLTLDQVPSDPLGLVRAKPDDIKADRLVWEAVPCRQVESTVAPKEPQERPAPLALIRS